MLNPVHLRTLQEVLEFKSFAAAANRLGYTASAVSQQMAALERDVGVVLFERTAHSIRPTPAAHVLARISVRLLSELEAMPRAVATVDNSAPRNIGLGIFPSAALHVLPNVLASTQWREIHADLTMQVAESSELIDMLLDASTVDIVLVYQFERSSLAWPSVLRARLLCRDPLVVLLPASWAEDRDLSPPLLDLAELPWISNMSGTSGARSIDSIWSQQRATPRVVARSDDYAVTTEMVRAAVGAALVPSMVAQHVPTGVVVRRPCDLRASREVLALTRGRNSDPMLESLSDLFASELAPIGASLEDRSPAVSDGLSGN
ncbi:LysR family transcriptional regulator [Leekyejoonella antrihumi]|uniref:LysR family transcriptional regulator n=1 Tax=Leekyejoonella antrihumi TaxID=1660198 RepID=A0A563E3J2_9MICO|nr:LysR family transcriptional regulator [Leekyejoonella antrihumi]TWP36464.1 LysR family transcriptional regulator [Leekyejoonella antrihumi]